MVTTAVYDDLRQQNKPSFYAPPIAWAAAAFSQALIESEGDIVPDRTGIIVASDECSLSTIREISRTAAEGSISPLRFAGASPSIVAGLPALQQGIRGPTACLTMPPGHAASAMRALINYWIRDCNIVAVIAISHYKLGERRHLFKGLIARSTDERLGEDVSQLGDSRTGTHCVISSQSASRPSL